MLAERERIFEDEAVDLVDLKRAPPPLVHRILKEGKCLYAVSRRRRVEFEMRAERLYWDTHWIRWAYLRSVVERVWNGTFGR